VPPLSCIVAARTVFTARSPDAVGFHDHIDLDAAVDAVHRANMSKLDDNGRPIMVDGKVSKGPNYQPPDIRAVLDG
jgi:predicted HAD superfamily Cof-like phosphohydrolase